MKTYHNTSLAREMSSTPCRYRQAQFPPPLTWMNRVQQAFSSPIHYLANAIILFNSRHINYTTSRLQSLLLFPNRKRMVIAVLDENSSALRNNKIYNKKVFT